MTRSQTSHTLTFRHVDETQRGSTTSRSPIVGLDLSLTRTGVACGCGTSVLTPRMRGPERLCWLRRQVLDAVSFHDPVGMVLIEGYSYASKQGGERLGELGGVVRVALWEHGVTFVEVAPTALKRFATGKGNANKDAVLVAAVRAGFDGDSNDAADAWWLREMGLFHLGLSQVPFTEYRVEAVGKVEWPEPAVSCLAEVESEETA